MLDLSTGVSLASALYRRAASGEHAVHLSRRSPEYLERELPSWTPLVVMANLILFFPVLFVLSYTFKEVFPVLAMVEDERSAYEPISLNEDAEDGAAPVANNSVGSATPATASFRGINRLLRANGGFSAYSRGFFCLLAYSLANGFLYNVFKDRATLPFLSLATLAVSLALVQLSTAWVHIVITPPSSAHFWQRLPPFRRTFDATARPTVLFWLALQIATYVPLLMAMALGVPQVAPGVPVHDAPVHDAGDVWKSVAIFIVAILVSVFLIIPAQVVLVRVQASLLPESEDTILAFDRSFGGAVAPAVVDGKGYATINDAWRTFSPSAWRRLIMLYVKIFLVNMAVMFGMALVIAPQVYVIYRHSTPKEPSHGSA